MFRTIGYFRTLLSTLACTRFLPYRNSVGSSVAWMFHAHISSLMVCWICMLFLFIFCVVPFLFAPPRVQNMIFRQGMKAFSSSCCCCCCFPSLSRLITGACVCVSAAFCGLENGYIHHTHVYIYIYACVVCLYRVHSLSLLLSVYCCRFHPHDNSTYRRTNVNVKIQDENHSTSNHNNNVPARVCVCVRVCVRVRLCVCVLNLWNQHMYTLAFGIYSKHSCHFEFRQIFNYSPSNYLKLPYILSNVNDGKCLSDVSSVHNAADTTNFLQSNLDIFHSPILSATIPHDQNVQNQYIKSISNLCCTTQHQLVRLKLMYLICEAHTVQMHVAPCESSDHF